MRYSPIYKTWVAVAERRQERPEEFSSVRESSEKSGHSHKFFCPFCIGHEIETPAEVDAISEPFNEENAPDFLQSSDTPGWLVRSIPNRFPFLEQNTERTLQKFGPHLISPNTGLQEVLIDVPFHGTELKDLSLREFQFIIAFYHRRLSALQKSGRWKYVQIFKNQGLRAGASLRHLHSQICALPFVPPSIVQEQEFLADFKAKNGLCWHCETMKYERKEKWRLVRSSEFFDVFCPFASRFPGEIWIQPRLHVPCFVQTEREERNDLAENLREIVRRLAMKLNVHDFNLVLRTSPWTFTSEKFVVDPNFHWRLEICPRTVIQAGFELGTGCFVNPMAPESAAARLAE